VNRLRLRAKLALVALVLLVLPLAGWQYVREMERFLLAAQEESLAATARAVATVLHERPQLLAARPAGESELRRKAERELQRLTGAPAPPGEEDPRAGDEVDAILKGVQRASLRIWVVSREYRVLALAGSLAGESLAEETIAAAPEIAAALEGSSRTRTRASREGAETIVSAAHPIWAGNEIVGAVVVEEPASRLALLRSRALERLLVATLAAFVLSAAVLFWFATRISARIRRLRDEAEAAIDARGRVTRLPGAAGTGDEIDDLARGFGTMLARLARYNAYLEALASRLSHELRTPIAVVRSSLENLRASGTPQEAQIYVQRAEEGLARLARILERMSEASRLEQSLSSAARERFDALPVVKGCVEGYRLAYPRASFALSLPETSVMLDGNPDLLAQMLDKLVENAQDFAAPGTPIRVTLGEDARLTVANDGPSLPPEIHDSLFDSMVSQRGGRADGMPHLGLGLYIARLIAEFHGGTLRAANSPDGRGVAFEASLGRTA
jgi:signal transduction histidine kinase